MRQTSLVNTQVSAYVLWKKDILLSGISQFPILKATDMLLVLTGQKIPVNTIHLSDSLNTQDRGLDTLLLKKTQTPW